MEKKIPTYEIILGFVISAILVVMLFSGYPMRWFITMEFTYLSSQTVPYLINTILVLFLTIGGLFVLKHFSLGLSSKNFMENFQGAALVMALLLATGIIAYYIGLKRNMGVSSPPITVLIEGILYPAIKNFTTIILFATLVLGSYLSLPWKKYKELISGLLMVGTLIVATVLGNLNLTRIAIVFHTCMAFGIGLYTASFRLKTDNSLLPAAVFGVAGIARIVFCFASDLGTPQISIFIISAVYIILGSISLGSLIINKEKNNTIISD